ncbi:hypothetical protein DK37_28155 [Halomonas sp. SUBG004]|nr:hypothetical protein DK37_28155 [Halomonas sp. SUBG004]
MQQPKRNVSLVEETSTASASLQDEASRLAELVNEFKLKTPCTKTRSIARFRLPFSKTFNTAYVSPPDRIAPLRGRRLRLSGKLF